ncbi:MAG: triose-phosphate isomerase [Pseudohongiellaceae bacterium]|jgi:triosephosphate isomerase|tara:strand:- start:616 stop:1404 length:789 start_codon:yes stop_codon:yes gene_type:complete
MVEENMRRKLIVGNWKMHGSTDQISQLLEEIESGSERLLEDIEICVCPTYLHLGLAFDLLASKSGAGRGQIKLGAQNVHVEPAGAFTGEVSAQMLAEYGVSYVIVGHSERRQFFAESDQFIAEKFRAAQACRLTPILCVGESLDQRQDNETERVVLNQLDAVIAAAGIAAMKEAVIAYEPVWAIGTGETATPAQAQQVHRTLREHLDRLDSVIAKAIRIIYGGSVNAANAKELFSQPDVDGGLVGGASLEAEEFISICKSTD